MTDERLEYARGMATIDKGAGPLRSSCSEVISECVDEITRLRSALTARVSPGEFTHSRSCPELTPLSDDRCTCGLAYRIALSTEQAMHNAWRKRAEEAELALTARDERARQCVEVLGVKLTNPSGEPFDELSKAVQVVSMNHANELMARDEAIRVARDVVSDKDVIKGENYWPHGSEEFCRKLDAMDKTLAALEGTK